MATETRCTPKHPTLRGGRMSENKRRPGEVSKPPPGLAATPTLEGALAVDQDSESPAGGVDEGLRVSSAARNEARAALERNTWPPCIGQDQHDTFAARDIADMVLTAALPHLTPKDLPLVAAQILRWAAYAALPRDRASRRPMEFTQVQDWLLWLATEVEGR